MNIQKYLQYLTNDWNPEEIEERILCRGSGENRKPYEWVWKDPFDDEKYMDERMWITDIFEQKTTQYTEERDRHPKFAPSRHGQHNRREDLQVGDTTQLDSFLADFVKQEVPSEQ